MLILTLNLSVEERDNYTAEMATTSKNNNYYNLHAYICMCMRVLQK